MADLTYRKLDRHEIEKALGDLDGWTSEGDAIAKNYAFPSYKDGIVFAVAVGFLADAMNHHPDLTIGYHNVGVRLGTHDVGGISPYDIELARRIDALSSGHV